MPETYSRYSKICSRFYDLIADPVDVASFVYSKVEEFRPSSALFVGGFFQVAAELAKFGLELTLVDYTDEMVSEGRRRLPNFRFEMADLRDLPFSEEFDCVFTVGRVFTHMISNEDAQSAITSIVRALTPRGVAFIDNYETSKIQATSYFNGRIEVADELISIARTSRTTLLTESPFVVQWSAEYRAISGTEVMSFTDEMPHRAFTREEFADLFKTEGLEVCKQGDNFDDTSFFTVARRSF